MQEHTAAGVYRITCPTTGRQYIGSSTNVNKRLTEHRYHLHQGQHHCAQLQEDWQHHPITYATIEHCPPDTIKQREQWHIVHAKRSGATLYNQRGAARISVTTDDELQAALDTL